MQCQEPTTFPCLTQVLLPKKKLIETEERNSMNKITNCQSKSTPIKKRRIAREKEGQGKTGEKKKMEDSEKEEEWYFLTLLQRNKNMDHLGFKATVLTMWFPKRAGVRSERNQLSLTFLKRTKHKTELYQRICRM